MSEDKVTVYVSYSISAHVSKELTLDKRTAKSLVKKFDDSLLTYDGYAGWDLQERMKEEALDIDDLADADVEVDIIEVRDENN